MAESFKILGQVAANATTTYNVYTVPAATQAVISSIVIVNRNADANCTYRVAAQQAGAALDDKQYIAYDAPIAALDTVALSLGVTLGNTDIISVYSANANLSFSVFGTEIT